MASMEPQSQQYFERPLSVDPHLKFLLPSETTPAYKDLGQRSTNLLLESLTDPLTGLKNEKAFNMALEGSIQYQNMKPEVQAGDESDLILLRIDVDGFKAVNDTLGHDAGDRVLRSIGVALRTGLRKTDAAQIAHTVDNLIGAYDHEGLEDDKIEVAVGTNVDEVSGDTSGIAEASRTHGDEFDILINNILARIDDPNLTMEQRIEAIKEHLRTAVTEAIESSEYDGRLFALGVGISIGVAIYKYGEDKRDFLIRGDADMYRDKAARKTATRSNRVAGNMRILPYVSLFKQPQI